MNFTAVRGFNAYAQFSAKIREAASSKSEPTEEPKASEDRSLSIYVEPVDTVTISESARKASAALATQREVSAHTEFRKWIRTEGMLYGGFKQKVPGSVLNDALSGSGIAVDDNEEFSIGIDVWSKIDVSSRNAEKAKAIQDLLNSTPSGINWGLLLAGLPPM